MIEINIAKDFTVTPGARYYADGEYSGEEFFETLLKPRFEEALERGVPLKIILDGTDGIPSSFLNEAFRRLGEAVGAEKAWNNLVFVSLEVPKYVRKIQDSINESKTN